MEENQLYTLTYFSSSYEEFIKKYTSLLETGGFIQRFHKYLRNEFYKDMGGGVSFRRDIDLKKESKNLYEFFKVIVKYE